LAEPRVAMMSRRIIIASSSSHNRSQLQRYFSARAASLSGHRSGK